LRVTEGCDRLRTFFKFISQTIMRIEGRNATVFVNPCAGGGKAGRKIVSVQDEFARRSFAARFVESRSAGEFQTAVRTTIAEGCKTLVAMGGDGTLQLLVREAMGHDASIGAIPVGGGNDFAAAVGIQSWKQAVLAIVQGKTRLVDIVRATFANGDTAEYLGGGGVGLDAETARYASGKFLKWPGRLRYLASAVAALRACPGVDVKIEFPGGDPPALRKRVLLVAALNTPSYGGGVRLAPEARLDDGELDFVILEILSRLEVARLLPRLLLTGELGSRKVARVRAPKAMISTEGRNVFHGDGELLGNAPVQIEVLPQAIRICVP
jgi:diacylglycerol kinase (ATP)